MDRALDGAIRLFTRALDDAGTDAGALAIRGEVPANVTQALADCTTYRGGEEGGLFYLALGITPDFKAMAYPPHCRLFFIINSAGICEDPVAAPMMRQIAPHQLPGPFIDAHFMRRWIRFILPTGQAMLQGQTALDALLRSLRDDLVETANRVPAHMASRADLQAMALEWGSGLPGTIARPLDDSVPRMNGLPVTPFIEEVLIGELARLQANGLRQQRA
jgi:hypothetical protein